MQSYRVAEFFDLSKIIRWWLRSNKHHLQVFWLKNVDCVAPQYDRRSYAAWAGGSTQIDVTTVLRILASLAIGIPVFLAPQLPWQKIRERRRSQTIDRLALVAR